MLIGALHKVQEYWIGWGEARVKSLEEMLWELPLLLLISTSPFHKPFLKIPPS